jgi:hypothetical protein
MQQFIRPGPVPNAFLQTDGRQPRTIDLKLRLINLAAVTIPFAGLPPHLFTCRWCAKENER